MGISRPTEDEAIRNVMSQRQYRDLTQLERYLLSLDRQDANTLTIVRRTGVPLDVVARLLNTVEKQLHIRAIWDEDELNELLHDLD